MTTNSHILSATKNVFPLAALHWL